MNNLYENLMKLAQETESFYFTDQTVDGKLYRIFSYRLASYTDFCRPDALECRGHTFLIDGDKATLVSRPPRKFFNAYENPMVMDLDFSKARFAMVKMDGSLISSVKTDDGFMLKTKNSFYSQQAVDATNLLKKMEAEGLTSLKRFIQIQASKNRTVNMEYCAPDNRVVIGYLEPKLVILNVRCNETGHTWYPYDMVHEWYDNLDDWICASKYFVNYNVNFNNNTFYSYDEILGMTGIEGFVIVFEDGRVCKCKSGWYKHLHSIRSNLNSVKNLYELVLQCKDDDYSVFPEMQTTIDNMKKILNHKIKDIHDRIYHVYERDKLLSRKDYAIKHREDELFSLLMMLYSGKEVDINHYLLKNYNRYEYLFSDFQLGFDPL